MKKSLLLLSLFGLASTSSAAVWINEIHYDNAGTDAGEFIEVAANADQDLTGWTVALYNGSASQLNVYATINLAGNLVSGNRAIAFLQAGIQNGAPDGMALVNDMGAVIEFICYEGTFTAGSGPASGMTCSDIGVSEPGAVGESLQRSDDGTGAAVWQAVLTATPNALNQNQGSLPVELMNFSVE